MELADKVRIGLKRIELRAHVTEMLESLSHGKQRALDWRGEAQEIDEGYCWVATKPGDRVLFLLGGSNPLDWQSKTLFGSVASCNLSTGRVYSSNRELAALALPPFNNFFGVTAIFVGLFSLLGVFSSSPGSVVFLTLSLGYFVWTQLRVRKLKRAIGAIAARYYKDQSQAAA